MGQATTAVSGDPSRETGSSVRPLPPTGPPTASASSKSRTGRRRLARSRRLFAFDRGLQSRFVAGTDEAGRGCLAGPLVAAAVLIDYEQLSHADRRALGRPARLQADDRGAAAGDVPERAAGGGAGQRRDPLRRRDRPPRPARDQHRSALGRARTAAPPAEATCLVDGFSLPRCAVPHRAVIEGDGTSAAIAAASVHRQGHPRPLHARRRRRAPAAGASTSTSATRPPSTARRSSGSGSRRCTAARSSRSPTPSWSCADR